MVVSTLQGEVGNVPLLPAELVELPDQRIVVFLFPQDEILIEGDNRFVLHRGGLLLIEPDRVEFELRPDGHRAHFEVRSPDPLAKVVGEDGAHAVESHSRPEPGGLIPLAGLDHGVQLVAKEGGVGVTFAVGDKVYWDDGNDFAVATDGAGANKLLGKAVAAAADADTTVLVRLSQ